MEPYQDWTSVLKPNRSNNAKYAKWPLPLAKSKGLFSFLLHLLPEHGEYTLTTFRVSEWLCSPFSSPLG